MTLKVRISAYSCCYAIALLCQAPTLSAHASLEVRVAGLDARIARYPQRASLYLERGALYRDHGQHRAAIADFQHAARLAPDRVEVELHLARTRLAARQPKLALQHTDRFLESQPEDESGRLLRARILTRLSRPLEAAREYDRSLERLERRGMRPQPGYYLERARALSAGGFSYLCEAIDGLDHGIEQLGPVISLEREALDLELESGDHEAALRRVDRLLAGSRRREAWEARRGEILLDAGRTTEGRQALETALLHIEGLPSHRRNTRRVSRLETRVYEILYDLPSQSNLQIRPRK